MKSFPSFKLATALSILALSALGVGCAAPASDAADRAGASALATSACDDAAPAVSTDADLDAAQAGAAEALHAQFGAYVTGESRVVTDACLASSDLDDAAALAGAAFEFRGRSPFEGREASAISFDQLSAEVTAEFAATIAGKLSGDDVVYGKVVGAFAPSGAGVDGATTLYVAFSRATGTLVAAYVNVEYS